MESHKQVISVTNVVAMVLFSVLFIQGDSLDLMNKHFTYISYAFPFSMHIHFLFQ